MIGLFQVYNDAGQNHIVASFCSRLSTYSSIILKLIDKDEHLFNVLYKQLSLLYVIVLLYVICTVLACAYVCA